MEIFPQNGRVLIIDNQIEQAKPLMKILSKNRVKYSYFIGDSTDKPDDPLQDIRLVFLDLLLRPVGTTPNPADDAKHDIKILKDLISKKNSLYILLIWSKNPSSDVADLVKTGIQAELDLPQPLKTIDLDKNEYFEIDEKSGKLVPKGDEREILKKIQDEINSQISSQCFFNLFSYWDNLVNNSTNDIINSFSKIDEVPVENNKKIWSLIYELAKAYSGQKIDLAQKDTVILNALFTFNGAFLDTLESNLKNSRYPGDILPTDQIVQIDSMIRAKINKKILTSEKDLHCVPGALYFEEENEPNDKIKKRIIDECCARKGIKELYCESRHKKYNQIFNPETNVIIDDTEAEGFKKYKTRLKSECKLICCEVTPSCDYAQDGFTMNRLIFGLLWPDEFSDCLYRHTKYLYISPAIEYEEKIFRLIFDLRYFHAKKKGEQEGKIPKLRLRHEILVDIQSHLAAHVHRPGVTSLETKQG